MAFRWRAGLLSLLLALVAGGSCLADCAPTPVPGAPSVYGPATNTLTVAASPSDPANVYLAFKITGGAYTGKYVQANGSIGPLAAWRLKTDWNAVTVYGLSAGTSYVFQTLAAQDGSGGCASVPGPPAEGTTLTLSGSFAVPPGFSASLWMGPGSGISGGDGISFAPYTGPGGGTRMYITNAYWGAGQVFSVSINPNGSAGATQLFASGFEDQIVSATYNPVNGYWYAGAGSKVYWMKDKNGDGDALDSGEKGILLSDLVAAPSTTRSKHAVDKVQFNPQNANELFFGVGSYSDHGELEDPPYQAIIRRAMLAPGNPEQVTLASALDSSYYIYASGLRNPSGDVFLTDGRLIATDHAPDCDVPEEMNVIVQGNCYGFPAWYADGTQPTTGSKPCFPQGTCNFTCPCPTSFTKPVGLFPAHASPIGVIQYTGNVLPLPYRGNLFVAEFGNLVNMSNASTGRRVSMFRPDSDDGGGHWQRSDFFMEPNTNTNTRQVSWLADVQQGPDGAIYTVEFSNQGLNSNTGSIYRLSFADTTPPTALTVQDSGSQTASADTLSVSWTPSFDPESSIRQYWYSVGTAPGATDTRGWTIAGGVLATVIQGLSLQEGQTYYVNVKAENGNLGAGSQGDFGPVASSDGITVNTAGAVAVQLSAPSAPATSSGPVTYTLTYLNATSVSLTPADVTLIPAGSATGSISVGGSGNSQRAISISNISGEGSLSISVAAGTASNDYSSAPAVGPSDSFIVDNTAPTISIAPPSPSATSGGDVTYVVSYTGADQITLAAQDVSLTATGSAACTVAVTGAGVQERTVTLSNITGEGTLAISIAAGTAADIAGNLAPASGQSDEAVVDQTPPSLSQASVAPGCVRTGTPLTVTATVQDTGSGIDSSGALLLGPNIALNGGFEFGGLSGWTSSVSPAYTMGNAYPHPGAAKSGSYWAGASCSGSSGVETPELRQTIAVTPGVAYYLSAWVNTTNSPNTCSAYLQYKDGTPPAGDGECAPVPGQHGSLETPTVGWQQLSGVVRPTSTQLTLCLKLSWSCAVAGGGGNWDAVEVRAGTPASSLSLDQATWDAAFNAGGFTLIAVDAAGNSSYPVSVPGPSVDDQPPVTSASAPASATGVVKVDWTASDSGCGSQIANVHLMARKSGGLWADSGLTGQSGGSGSFFYVPANGSGVYYFAVIASDSLGNTTAAPSGPTGTGQTSCTVTDATSVQRIGQLWGLSDGAMVSLQFKTVSAVLPGSVYIQEPDRSAGVRIAGAPALSVGDTVTLAGPLQTQGQEREITAETLYLLNAGEAPRPLFTTGRDLGGKSPAPSTPGAIGSGSLFNVGLLVSVSGRVSFSGSGFYYLDDGAGLSDGSGHAGVKVYSAASPSAGSFVAASGVCGLENAPGGLYPVVRTRSESDTIVVQ